MPCLKIIMSPEKMFMIIILTMIVIGGCAPRLNENPVVDLRELKVGETVYVCGCPDMCCNSISRDAGGQCACNYPLKQGVILKIQEGKIYVKVSSQEKIFYIPKNNI